MRGFDISEEFIEQAKARAIEEGFEDKTEFQVEDMRRLDEWEGSYDLITNFWNSLGYYDKETDIGILESMRQLLSEDGKLAIEMGIDILPALNSSCRIKSCSVLTKPLSTRISRS